MSFRSITAATILLAASAAWAEPTKFVNEVNSIRQMMNDCQNVYAQYDFNASNATKELSAEDRVAAKKWFDDLNTKLDGSAKLFEDNKEPEARAAFTEALKMSEGRFLWSGKLNCRQRQLDSAPTEEWVTAQRGWTIPATESLLSNMIEVRKLSSEAWGHLADVMAPGTPQADIDKAQDAANTSVSEVGIADAQLAWARQMWEMQQKRDLSPELASKVKAVETSQDEIVAIARERNAADLKIHALDMQRQTLEKQREQQMVEAMAAYFAARNAQQQQQQEKQQH